MTSFDIYTVKESDSSSAGNHQIIYNTFRQFYAHNSPYVPSLLRNLAS